MGGGAVQIVGTLIPTSSAAVFSNALGHLDDAESIMLCFTSSANANTSAAKIQVSQFDPGDATPIVGATGTSTGFFNLSSELATITSSGSSVVIFPVPFRGIRLSITTSNAGEVIATVSKQIVV